MAVRYFIKEILLCSRWRFSISYCLKPYNINLIASITIKVTIKRKVSSIIKRNYCEIMNIRKLDGAGNEKATNGSHVSAMRIKI